MKCDEAAEFVSALCDGQQIPREAAEHIGACETCRALLHEYSAMGAELRRVASLQSPEVADKGRWNDAKQVSPHWWQKGWESVRIPKFAFALLVVLILLLGSGLAIIKARPTTVGKILFFTLQVPGADPARCGVPASGPRMGEPCGNMVTTPAGELKVVYRVIQNDGNQITLGVRTQLVHPAPDGFGSYTVTLTYDDMVSMPEKQYIIQAGEGLEIEIHGIGKVLLKGELLDYLPILLTATESLVPARDELRILSPIVLRNNRVVIDFEGSSASPTGKDWAVFFYAPPEGRFIIAQAEFDGAVEAHVERSRMHFKLHGEDYELLAGAPISRADTLWIRNDPHFRPSKVSPGRPDDRPFLGNGKLKEEFLKVN